MKNWNKVLASMMAFAILLSMLPVSGFAAEAPHTHTAECYNVSERLKCDADADKAHEHSAECYEQYNALVCGKEKAYVVRFACEREDVQIAVHCGDTLVESSEGNSYVLAPGSYRWEASSEGKYASGEFTVADEDAVIDVVLQDVSDEQENGTDAHDDAPAPDTQETYAVRFTCGEDVQIAVYCGDALVESGEGNRYALAPGSYGWEAASGDKSARGEFTVVDAEMDIAVELQTVSAGPDNGIDPQADGDGESGITFVPVDPDDLVNNYNVNIKRDGVTEEENITLYCLQQAYQWPREDVVYFEKDIASDVFEYKNLLSPDEVQILRKLVFAGYPNDSQGILRKYDIEYEFQHETTNMAIWGLMRKWEKSGQDYNQDFSDTSDKMVLAAIEMMAYAEAPGGFDVPETDDVLIEGDFTLHELSNGEYSTEDLQITRPLNLDLLFSLEVTDGLTVVDGDGNPITAIGELESFRIIADSREAVENGTLTASAVLKYPSDVTFYVTSQLDEGKKQQTMLSVSEMSKNMAGTFPLTPGSFNTVDVEGKKTWEDGNDQDGMRPEDITVRLYANGVEKDHRTVSARDNWEWSFSGLPQFESGVEVVYTISEDRVVGYTTDIDGFSITNSHQPETIDIRISKIWEDDNDLSGARPRDITVQLVANGLPMDDDVVLNERNGWTGSFEGLPKYKDGEEIRYTVVEDAVPEYESTVTGTAASGFTVTNKYVPKAYGNLVVSKTVAGSAADTSKAFRFTVTLSDTEINGTYGDMTFANGVASFTLKHGESKTAENLPEGIDYTVTEADYTSDGYLTTSTGASGTIAGNDTKTAAFRNVRNAYGNLTVSKTVDGKSGSKIKSFRFTVELSDDTISGTYGDMIFVRGTARFTLAHGKSKTAVGLPHGITYTVTEEDYSADGYSTTKSGDKGSILEGKTAVAAFTNTKNTSSSTSLFTPKTGDGTHLMRWVGLFAVSAAGLTASVIIGRKKKENE